MERKNFIKQSVLAGAAALSAPSLFARSKKAIDEYADKTFNMNYAIHDGMFSNHAGKDFIDQIKFAYDKGFRAVEDNGMRSRDAATQEKIGNTLKDLKMTMGVFVCHDIDWQKPSLTTGDKAIHDKFLAQVKESVDVAKRCGAKWMVAVPGLINHNKNIAYQKASVLDVLRKAADILAPHDLTFLLEPLNFRDHPSQVLPDIPNIYEMVRFHIHFHENVIRTVELSFLTVALRICKLGVSCCA